MITKIKIVIEDSVVANGIVTCGNVKMGKGSLGILSSRDECAGEERSGDVYKEAEEVESVESGGSHVWIFLAVFYEVLVW
jgi:hypothetical protein